MLIRIEFKIQLLAIEFLFFVRRDEKFRDVIFSEQSTTKDSHDLHDGSPKFEVMLNDSDKTVCDDGNVNLNTHCIVALSPKELDSEMLLDPFEEHLHLPSISIKERDVLGCKVKVIRIVSERPMQFWSIIDDTPNFARVLLLVLLLRKDNGLVTQDVVCSVKNVVTINNLILWVILLSDDKEGSGYCNLAKSSEVKVTSVKDIASQRFVCEPVHCIDIMHVGIGDSIENRNLCDNIHLSMDFDAGLSASELCPSKKRHTEVNSRRVHSIELAVQFKLSSDSSLLCEEHHVEGKLLKDAVVPEVVSLGKRTLVDGCLSESEMKRFLGMGGCYICEFSQTSATHKLPENENEKLTPVRRSPILGSVIGFGHETFEISLWKKTGYLSENVMSDMHICPYFDLGTKVRISKVRQDFINLSYCA